MQMSVLMGSLMLLLGAILIMGGTVISMLLDIYKILKLAPKTGYVFTCATIYVVGFLFVGIGFIVILVAIPIANHPYLL